jgi:hypothetical protein
MWLVWHCFLINPKMNFFHSHPRSNNIAGKSLFLSTLRIMGEARVRRKSWHCCLWLAKQNLLHHGTIPTLRSAKNQQIPVVLEPPKRRLNDRIDLIVIHDDTANSARNLWATESWWIIVRDVSKIRSFLSSCPWEFSVHFGHRVEFSFKINL